MYSIDSWILRKSMLSIFLVFGFIFISLIFVSSNLYAQNAQNAQSSAHPPRTVNKKDKSAEEELQENKRLIAKLKNQLNEQHLKESETMTALKAIEQELNIHISALAEADAQIEKGEKELVLLQDSMEKLNQSFQDKLKVFSVQMKAAYLFKKNSPMKLFLSQQNPHQIARILHYYQYIEKNNYEVVSRLLNEMHTLSVHQNELITKTKEVTELKEAKLTLIEAQKKEKETYQKKLQAIQKDSSQISAALLVYQQNEKELLSQLSSINARRNEVSPPKFQNLSPLSRPSSFTKAQGKLLWPIRKEPRTSLMSPFMIKAKEGESVHATFDGQVVFADRLRGFGLLVIIDHGEGYMSLYGQNQTLYKNVGDTVKRGDVVALVGARLGSRSELKDSGLYFEIRKNGKPTNLVNWFN